MTRPLRAVVLGYGFIGNMHVEAAATLGDVDVVGVAGHHLDRATEFARRHGIERVTTDWASLCAEPDVDLVIIGTPNAFHAAQTIHALDHDKHVLVEKPMATTTVDADRMIDAATRAERTLAAGHMWRYHPDVIALRDRVARVSAPPICARSVPPHDLRPLRPGMRDPRGTDCAWGRRFSDLASRAPTGRACNCRIWITSPRPTTAS